MSAEATKMFNFLDHKLMPKVTCTSPSTENYEPENLVSPNEAIRARGFLAYTVIKPPVELEFEFICPVDVSYVRLDTAIGKQRCTGIEVFAKNSATQAFASVAKAVYDRAGVVFCNNRKYSRNRPPPALDDTKSLHFFKRDTFNTFSNTSAIKVVIFRTERSVPCIASVQVVGLPARACSKATVETVQKIMGSRPGPTKAAEAETPGRPENGLKVPEDFLDDLTCEIMAVPMTLPSGKTVDRDTLEKHLQSEKSFGRRPGDPFTGLKFTDRVKPVLNVALKSRIDMFLLRHSSDPATFGVKRTLGNGGSGSVASKRLKLARDEGDGDKKCGGCGDNKILYWIPCKHFFCRSCLLKLERFRCASCHVDFARNDAVRSYD